MAITPLQRKQRRRHIGSSDAMALMLGIDAFGNTLTDLYLDKTGQTADREPNHYMTTGTYLERGILDWAQLQLGPLLRSPRRVSSRRHLAANIDAIVKNTGRPVEAKAVFRPPEPAFIFKATENVEVELRNDYGAPGTDEVPVGVRFQCQVHLICQPADFCHVVALLSGRLMLYQVSHNPELAEAIQTAAERFMVDHVKAGVPPEDSRASLAVLKRLVRVPDKTVPVHPDLVRRYFQLCDARPRLKHMIEAAEADLLDDLGDAEAGDLGELGKVTYYEQRNPPKADCKRLMADGLGQYVTQGTHRVLRWKTPKGVLCQQKTDIE